MVTRSKSCKYLDVTERMEIGIFPSSREDGKTRISDMIVGTRVGETVPFQHYCSFKCVDTLHFDRSLHSKVVVITFKKRSKLVRGRANAPPRSI